MPHKQTKGPMLRYNELNILQKINVKANAVGANIKHKVGLDGWHPMDRAICNWLHIYSEYCSPFKFKPTN